jgi:DNA polymerase-3 subunit alpha
MYLVFDTETTGLPPTKRPLQDSKGWETCRIVEIAWNLYDQNGELISRQSHVIKPDGFVVPQRAANIHGITTEIANAEGIEINKVLEMFFVDLARATTLVAHNIKFDSVVILSELYRYNKLDIVEEFNKKRQCCTMIMGTPPKGRWPKLSVLFTNLFGEEPHGTLHRAACDVDICAKCFFRMTR